MNTYQDMAGDAGYINIPDDYDGDAMITLLEDIAYGPSTVYPHGSLEEVEPMEGPTVPEVWMERAQAAIDKDSKKKAEEVLDALCEFWFQGDEEDE